MNKQKTIGNLQRWLWIDYVYLYLQYSLLSQHVVSCSVRHI
ncbi:unnamed protein product [Haemonchus placei]|uniref:Uncharacterized protein n=1 Tax=Haemonchus placei TaxID=6290 RepID=A0A0N4W1B6_HAEPC|nr:unnamed protein product [Haemonchus placei]